MDDDTPVRNIAKWTRKLHDENWILLSELWHAYAEQGETSSEEAPGKEIPLL